MTGAGLRIRLLGSFDVEGCDLSPVRSRKARTLLRILAVARGEPVSADRLVDLLWGDAPPADPPGEVSVLVSRLRAVLGAPRLVRVAAGYAVPIDWTDVEAASLFAEEAEQRLAAGAVAAARAAATAALRLCRGPFLADEPDAGWLRSDREAAARLLGRVRRIAAASALAAGELGAAAEVAQSALDADPDDEAALRLAMAALAADGRRAAALALFERARMCLADELGVDPSDETAAAHVAVLKGEPIRGVPAAPRGGAAMEPAMPPPGLPGRAAELAQLDGALAGGAGAVGLVAVEGEAGIGKSRLVSTWAGALTARGVPVLLGRCDELGRALPLQAVLDALADALRGRDQADVAAILGDDTDLLRGAMGAAQSSTALGAAATADPATARALLLAAALRGVVAVLGVLGGGVRGVVVVEDAHVADPATVDWMRLARRRAADRLLLVATRRVEEGSALDADMRVSLGPLDLAATAEIVGAADAGALHARTGGNPLLLVELARSGADDELPSSLLDAVGARCDRAGEPVAVTLRSAAVLGPWIDLDVLGPVLRLDALELLSHLEEGVRRRLLEERSEGFGFRHELVREALVAGTGAPRRAVLHREAARLLEGRPGRDPLRLAYHARQGGDTRLAATALVEAAHVAAGRGDVAQAGRLLDDATALADLPAVRVERARLHIRLNDHAAALDEALEARRLGAGAVALETAAVAEYHRRRFDAALRLADTAEAEAEDPGVRAAALLVAGRTLHAMGDLPAAERRIAAADSSAARHLWLAFIRAHQGRPAEALELLDATSPAGEESANIFAPVHLRFVRSFALCLLGRADAALAELDLLDSTAERLGMTRFAGRSDNFRGWILRGTADNSAADELTRRAIAAGERIRYDEVQAQGWLDLADSALQRDDADGARAALRAATPFGATEHAFRWRHLLRARLLGARLDLLEGRAEEGAAAAGQAVSDARARGIDRYVAIGGILAARCRAAAGEGVDPASVAAEVERLDRVAALEAWRLTAEAAADLRVDAWWSLAELRAAAVAAAAGPRGDAAARRLDAALDARRAAAR